MNIVIITLVLVCLSWSTSSIRAEDFSLPPDDIDLIGDLRVIKATYEDTLIDIARRHDLGRDEIVYANPKVDPWLPKEGTKVLLPTRYIIPNVPRTGIVVNSPEMRLYYFPPAAPGAPRKVITHPVSVGRVEWNTPQGITKIMTKIVDPAWHPPASIRAEAVAKGTPLPEVVPAGPDNPLGRFAMRLALPGSYLIHGTDKPFGIGMQVTHGCMRLYPEDIESLFKQVPVDTQVHLIDEPIKLGWFADTLFVEITQPLEEDVETSNNLLQLTLDKVHAEYDRRPFILNGAALKQAVKERLGIPVAISKSELVP